MGQKGKKMKINDILFKIKTALSLSDEDMIKAYKLADYNMSTDRLNSILKRHQDKDYAQATYEELGVFLDGLIALKRGEKPNKPQNEEVALDNNLIMKKLRVALELKEPELLIVFGLSDIEITKRQIGSLFRRNGHKNFKVCSDELLIGFLDGLDEFYYSGEEI